MSPQYKFALIGCVVVLVFSLTLSAGLVCGKTEPRYWRKCILGTTYIKLERGPDWRIANDHEGRPIACIDRPGMEAVP